MINRNPLKQETLIKEFDHEPTEQEKEEALKKLEEAFWERLNSIYSDYNVILFDIENAENQDTLHLEDTDINDINMYQSINSNCVIDLLHLRYNTPKEELELFFDSKTSAKKINEWCIINKVPHYAFDLLDNSIYHTPIKSHKRALVYTIADEHINEIINLSQRKRLIYKKSLISTKRLDQKKKVILKPVEKWPHDIPQISNLSEIDDTNKSIFDTLKNVSGTYYTTDSLLYVFGCIAMNERRPPKVIADNSTIYQIKYKKLTIKKVDESTLNLYAELNKQYNGESITSICDKFIDKKPLESKYNVQTYDLIKNSSVHSLYYKFGDYSLEELNEYKQKGQLVNLDIKRCYPTVCINFPMPYLKSSQTLKPFDGTPKPKYWYVINHLKYSMLAGNNSFVPYEMLEYLDDIEITHQILPYYSNILQEPFKTVSKLKGNMFIGTLSRTTRKRENVIYSYSLKEIGYYAFLTKSKVNYVDFNGKRLYKTCPEVRIDINQFKYRFAYLQIILQARILCYRMYLETRKTLKNSIPIYINTDGILLLQKKKVSLKQYAANDEYGSIRKKPINDFIRSIEKSKEFRPREYKVIVAPKINVIEYNYKWNTIEVAKETLKLDGGVILGSPGTGKTTLLEAMQEEITLLGKKYITATFTRAASTLIPNATSLHDVFNVKTIENFDITDNIIRYYKDDIDYILIDEASMITRRIYEAVSLIKSNKPSIKIFLFADFLQFPPINDELMTHSKAIVRFLTHGNEINLKYQFRSNPEFINNLINKKYDDIKPNTEPTKFNICLTNEKCDELNNDDKYVFPHSSIIWHRIDDFIYSGKYKQELTDGLLEILRPGYLLENDSYIRFDKTTKFKDQKIPKNLIANVEFQKDKVYITQLFNGNLHLSKEYVMSKIDYINLINKKNIVPGKAITAYKSQGITIREPYTVHQTNHFYFKDTAKYVSFSRTSDPNLVSYRP